MSGTGKWRFVSISACAALCSCAVKKSHHPVRAVTEGTRTNRSEPGNSTFEVGCPSLKGTKDPKVKLVAKTMVETILFSATTLCFGTADERRYDRVHDEAVLTTLPFPLCLHPASQHTIRSLLPHLVASVDGTAMWAPKGM